MVGEQIGLRQGDDPDAGEGRERLPVLEEVVVVAEEDETVVEVGGERLEVATLFAGVVQQLLSIDHQERNVGT